MEITFTKSKKNFDEKDKKYFNEEIAKESEYFGNTLFALRNFLGIIKDCEGTAEMYYELEQSKKNEPEAWKELAYEEECYKVWERRYFKQN